MKIRNFLGLKRRRATDNPHKRAPDVYFKHIYFSKPLYEGFRYISELKEQSTPAYLWLSAWYTQTICSIRNHEQGCLLEGTVTVGTTGGSGALFGLGTAAIVHGVFQGKKTSAQFHA